MANYRKESLIAMLEEDRDYVRQALRTDKTIHLSCGGYTSPHWRLQKFLIREEKLTEIIGIVEKS